MSKIQVLKESAKYFDKISEETFSKLVSLTEEKQFVDFDNVDQYEQFQLMVKEGYLEKSFRNYSITPKGKDLLEARTVYVETPEKFNRLITEDVGTDCVVISYKKHEFKTNTICTEEAKFELEKDGIPVVKVSEEVYANLIHRERGQHWKQYLGEEGRQLIRQKKLSRFYVEDESTGRRYLYLVP